MQHNKYFKHQDVKFYCTINQFLEFKFLWTHNKPQGVRGLDNHYNMCFDPKLGHSTCEIRRTPCAFPLCTYMLDQPWVAGMPAVDP